MSDSRDVLGEHSQKIYSILRYENKV